MLDRRRFVALSSRAAALRRCRAGARAGRARRRRPGPTRFVRLVVPFPPGGGTDAIARVVAGKLSAIWGQQMVVENKGGGATSIGTDTVAKADPDGYTVLLQSVPLAVNKFLFATLPFDPVADLAPVSLICDYPNVMAVPMSSPAHTVQEFIAYAKANPGKVTYASSGHGTSVHLSGELFNKMTGLEAAAHPVSRRGAGAQRSDPRPRRRDVQQHRRGDAAHQGRQAARARRHLVEARGGAAGRADRVGGRRAGLRRVGLVCAVRAGQDAARGHPKLHADTVAALADPATKARLEQLGVGVIGSSPEELRALSQGRDGQVGRHHQGGRNQGRMTRNSGAPPGMELAFWTGRNRASINPRLAPQCPGSSVGRACD